MLVDFNIMQGIRPISANNKNRFDIISKEVEDYYLPKLLGASFAYDVQKNGINYVDLLDGVEFNSCINEIIRFKGLRYILAYFIFAEYVDEIKFKDTYSGMVVKNRQEAFSLKQGQNDKIKLKYRSYAESETEIMKLYLNVNYDKYPLWGSSKDRAYAPVLTNIRKI